MKDKYSFEHFSQSNWSFVLLKRNKVIYKSKLDGLKPLIGCIKKYRKEMRSALVYDKIIGKAAAILLVFSGVKEIWTRTISKSGKEYLEKNKIKITYKNLTDCVLSRRGDGQCPMEKMSEQMAEKDFVAKMTGWAK